MKTFSKLLSLCAVLLLSGCLDIDVDVRVGQGGGFAGHVGLSAPQWLLESWGADPAADADPVWQILADHSVYLKEAGRGAWIAGTDIQHLDLPFLQLRYLENDGQWNALGVARIEQAQIARLEQEVETRTRQMRDTNPARAALVRERMIRGTKMNINISFPYAIAHSNGAVQGSKVSWEVSLEQLLQSDGQVQLMASGAVDRSRRLSWFPVTELD